MGFAWLKRYVPRSLYGRAALILLVPVVTLQLVVSVVFIQRHFDGVTEQMTRNVARELRLVLRIVGTRDSPGEALAAVKEVAIPLAFMLTLPDPPPELDRRMFYDISGWRMIETLRRELDDVLAVDLRGDSRSVAVWLQTPHGPMQAGFDRRRVTASNPHQLLVLMVVTGLLMTLISFVYLRNQLRPITRLAAASEAFGKGQVLAYKPSGATEVRAAGKAFLDMRARTLRQIEQRTLMLSGVSHDLRTPLTRLRLGLAMLEDEAETRELLRDIADMERLLDEFLAFARDDSLGDAEECDPAELVRSVVERHDGRVHLAGIEGQGRAILRPMAVARALDNLIGNAIRYGTRCEVRLTMAERSLRITVEDDGPGIAEDQREEASKPFVRLDAARNQNRGSGVGLGLAIAQDIARKHGGSLLLGESEKLGGLRAELVLAR